MPKFAANLSMLYNEHAFLDRFAAAASDGFKAVEYLFPYEHPAAELSARQRDNGLQQVRFSAPAGDWQALSPTLMGGFHEGMDIGIDRRAPVEWELIQRRGSFRYSGTVHDLVVDSGAFAPDSTFARG